MRFIFGGMRNIIRIYVSWWRVTNRRGRKRRAFPLSIGHDPSLWHFASVQEALTGNCNALARLIVAGTRGEPEQPSSSLKDDSEVEFA